MKDGVALWVRDFRRTANFLAVHYGGPVHLVGSALHASEPRDYDVRILMPWVDLTRLFGRPNLGESRELAELHDFGAWEWRRGYTELKASRQLSEHFRCLVDLKLLTPTEANRWVTESLRLDTAPDHVLMAGLGPATQSAMPPDVDAGGGS